MQPTYGAPPGYSPPPPPSKSPWPLILGIGCGGCALLIVLAVGGLYFVGRSVVREAMKPGVPPPSQYVGVWESQDGQKLTIRQDGHAAYYGTMSGGNGNLKMDTGRVDINSTANTLSVTILGMGRTFHIDKPPHKGNQGMEMTLDGAVFRQSFAAPPKSGAPSSGSESDTS